MIKPRAAVRALPEVARAGIGNGSRSVISARAGTHLPTSAAPAAVMDPCPCGDGSNATETASHRTSAPRFRVMIAISLAVAFAALFAPGLALADTRADRTVDPFVFEFSIFVLAIFVGYYVVWSVTPALHTPLMAVTNAISSVIIVGALLAVAVEAAKPDWSVPPRTIYDRMSPNDNAGASITLKTATDPGTTYVAKGFGLAALILASVNIFGGFLVTSRMLSMYKKKEKKTERT